MSWFDFLGLDAPAQGAGAFDDGEQAMQDFHLMPDGTPEPSVPEAPSLWSQMSDSQRFGAIGGALQKIGSQLNGEPQPALHLDPIHAPDISGPHGAAGQVTPFSPTPLNVGLPGKPGALALRALGQLRDYI